STVGFFATGSNGQQGVYFSSNGVLDRLADTSTLIPNGSGTFVKLNAGTNAAGTLFGITPVHVSGNSVAFIGSGNNGPIGFYAGSTTGGPLIRLADRTTPIQGMTGTTFSEMSYGVYSGSGFAFRGVGGVGGGGTFGIFTGSTPGGPVVR